MAEPEEPDNFSEEDWHVRDGMEFLAFTYPGCMERLTEAARKGNLNVEGLLACPLALASGRDYFSAAKSLELDGLDLITYGLTLRLSQTDWGPLQAAWMSALLPEGGAGMSIRIVVALPDEVTPLWAEEIRQNIEQDLEDDLPEGSYRVTKVVDADSED